MLSHLPKASLLPLRQKSPSVGNHEQQRLHSIVINKIIDKLISLRASDEILQAVESEHQQSAKRNGIALT